MTARRLSARWVYSGFGRPIEQGAVLIEANGRIAMVGADGDVPTPPGVPAEFFPDAALLPGFVNTHTHLELTGLDGRVQDGDFPSWIRALRAVKAERSPDEVLDAARHGLTECYAAGVTTIADTGDSGTAIRALAEAGGSGVAYQEVFGAHPDDADASLAGLQEAVGRLGQFAGGRVRLGVSPHAPYTVSGPLYRAVARWARSEALPVAVHLAESHAESALLRDGTGSFAEAWRERGIPLPPPGRSPVEWLDEHEVLEGDTLAIHLVQVTSADIDRLARRGVAVAHCPRSNAVHGHGNAPLRAMADARLRIGVGTDSVVSLAPLDLMGEARMACQLGNFRAEDAIALCTSAAAGALGLADQIGLLKQGFWGDCVAIHVGRDVEPDDLCARILETGPADVAATYLAGRPVFRAASLSVS